MQGDLFCKSRLLNLGSDEKIQECQDFLQTFIPAALKAIAKKVEEDSHYVCYNLFDEICSLEVEKVCFIQFLDGYGVSNENWSKFVQKNFDGNNKLFSAFLLRDHSNIT